MAAGRILSKHRVKQIISPIVRPYWSRRLAKYAGFSDLKYYAPTAVEIRQILAALNNPSPRGELFDCDDYAFALKAHVSHYARETEEFEASPCIGIAWARFSWIRRGKVDHACNWVLGSDIGFRWIEPQNKSFHKANQCRGRLTLLLA